MNSPIIVTFAGPVGSGKTPIAHYLSYEFNLPIYSNDATRTEVTEDLLNFDQEKYLLRRDGRINKIINDRKSFVLDASVDREWENYLPKIKESKYRIFIISIDLSKDFLLKLYEAKNYKDLETLDKTIKNHKEFCEKFSDSINVNITDDNYTNRLEICKTAFKSWL